MLFWFHIMNLATAESAKRDSELVRCLSETFGIAIAFVCGGQGDTSHPNAFQGHSAIYECGNMLSDHTGQSIGNNTYALESFSFCRDLDCDILNACQRFPSAQQPDIIITENTGKKGLLREVHNDPFLPIQQQEAEQYLSTLFQLQVESLVSRVTNTGLHRLGSGCFGWFGLYPCTACLPSGIKTAGAAFPESDCHYHAGIWHQ